jgi:hypothetical protein
MIAWVASLIVLLSTLIAHLERVTALEIMSVNTRRQTQQNFVAAEQAILECQNNLSSITPEQMQSCYLQSAGKNYWLISSKEKPIIEVLVLFDEKTGLATRLNWRQALE